MLALRALFWTLAFPGLFAFYIPWRVFGVSPTLRRQFGDDYDRYARAVGRWVPRLSPYRL